MTTQRTRQHDATPWEERGSRRVVHLPWGETQNASL
jgi:hypothetical protein